MKQDVWTEEQLEALSVPIKEIVAKVRSMDEKLKKNASKDAGDSAGVSEPQIRAIVSDLVGSHAATILADLEGDVTLLVKNSLKSVKA